MYNPPRFLDKSILDEVLSEFKWPALYIIGDDTCPSDGLEVSFPQCTLYFVEGFESDMSLRFSWEQTQTAFDLNLSDALYIMRNEAIKNPAFKEPALTGYFEPGASLEKVKKGLRDICILLQAYMLPCLEGDFSWVNKYKEKFLPDISDAQ